MTKSNIITILEAVRLLNSTPLETVITERRLRRLMSDFGISTPRIMAIGGRLLKLRTANKKTDLTRAAKRREWQRAHQAELAASGRNISEIPDVVDPERRARCEKDLALFIMTYAGSDKQPFSRDHFRVIKRIETAIFSGGRFVEAVYRGFGKTTISELTAVWAICYGHKKFVPIVAANEPMADRILESIKGTFESDELYEDFPEICHAVQALEGITQRAHGQLYQGKQTDIEWGKHEIVMPMIPGSISAGSIIVARGITSSKIRGMKKRRQDGVQLRPDFFIIDDPQDEASASNPAQVTKRLNIIKKSILKSRGHFQGISIIMPCTVSQKDDLVDQLLDHQKNPSWQGERIPMVLKFADLHKDFWLGEYAEMRENYDPAIEGDQLRAHAAATALYKSKREAADAGCEISWEHCYSKDDGEISAIQHAYNSLIDDGAEVFASECQSKPLSPDEESGQLTKDEVLKKLNNLKRGEIPVACQTLTMFIDLQQTVFYYLVVAWTENFTGYVIDYGTLPGQSKNYFLLRNVMKTLDRKYPGTGLEGAWRAGLDEITKDYLAREWLRDDGVGLRITRCLIDANDGNAMETVFNFCRQSQHATIVTPSRGRGVTAARTPFRDYKRKPGDKVSDYNWRMPAPPNRRSVRHVIFDTNWWKSFVRTRWRVAKGDPGALTVFGQSEEQIDMFADHMISEFSTRTEGRGRKVDEWAHRPNMENHWWDCIVGCAVAASMEGIVEGGIETSEQYRKKRGGGGRSMRQLQADARARR